MKLYDIVGKNKYCGPAVIAALTGVTTDDAATAIRHHSKQRAVRGAQTTHLIRALSDFGLHATNQTKVRGLTLNQWFKHSVKQRTAGRVFLVVAGHHFQIVTGRRYICGRTRELISIRADAVKRRSRVAQVYEMTGKAKLPAYPHPVSEKAQVNALKAKAKVNAARAKVMRLADKYGITLDVERYDDYFRCWVYEPEGVDVPSYLDDERCRHDWDDALTRVEELVEFLNGEFQIANKQ